MTTYRYTGVLNIIECANCHMDFGITPSFERDRRNDRTSFYCPSGHKNYYPGKTLEDQLRETQERLQASQQQAQTRETALKDQLHAAESDAETQRRKRLKDRIRISNGVCPCCNRTFQNVLSHMKGEHPDYVISPQAEKDLRPAKCSCGRAFATQAGLHRHQASGRQQARDWYGYEWSDPNVSPRFRHLTTVE